MDEATRETEKADEPAEDQRAPYEAPRLTKKRSIRRVTLFSGGGPTATGPTGASGLTSA